MASTDAVPGVPRRVKVSKVSDRLPDFPWDRLQPHRELAAAHPGGIVDLSVGTPVDSTPEVAQAALRAASDSPGYPLTTGSPELRTAITEWLLRRTGSRVEAVLPVVGTKELVAALPAQLGLGPGDVVVVPELAYPTYEVGARLAGADVLVADSPASERLAAELGGRRALVWLNSPGNPTGRVLSRDELRAWVGWAREHDAVVASDECYAELWWDERPASVLEPDVSGGDHSGLLAVHSLSKRSNFAGYRAGFVAGDPALVAELLAVRRHAGLMLPGPIQAAAAVALADDSHVAEQLARYGARREVLAAALRGAGFKIEHSTAGLYLWATRDEDCWTTIGWLAEHGILAAPGEFYGVAGQQHVRVALTATDERVAAAAERLA